ncbi:copper chaperone for superoxide dismutase-like isoform X2 [Gigantopelta aegis]|uniref:copper chaperone for superoxide dismutase-like isoform X2 n=1 Tax=Gigantopelta aegis TaxID=1735272 RepID=UPI001B88962E|nr:copper chaperone for superoxide dismutase-like isoform X2 [Gigantopelta aegis]
MSPPTKLEFAVQMTCQGCVEVVHKSLKDVQGITSIEVILDAEKVIVETTLPSETIKSLLEKTGKRAVLQGMGSMPSHLGAAVSILDTGSEMIKGVIRFVQSDEKSCVIEGTVDGLPSGNHTLCIHELGDISQGCKSCGDIFGEGLTEKVKGILRELKVGTDGRAIFRFEENQLKVSDMIGRSTVIHCGTVNPSKSAGTDQDKRLVCGIIARSAGLFENPKKICACDGVTIWEERDKPLAGGNRSNLS